MGGVHSRPPSGLQPPRPALLLYATQPLRGSPRLRPPPILSGSLSETPNNTPGRWNGWERPKPPLWLLSPQPSNRETYNEKRHEPLHQREFRHLHRLSAQVNRLTDLTELGGLCETGGGARRRHHQRFPPLPAPPVCLPASGITCCVSLPYRQSGAPFFRKSRPVTQGSSHHRWRQTQLLPLLCLRLQARGGLPFPYNKSCRFRAPNQSKRGFWSSWVCRPRMRMSRGWEARAWLSGGHPRRGHYPSPQLVLHLVPPRPTTVPPPSSLSLMLLFLSVPQPRPPGARTRAGAARVARWRRQRLRLQQLRRLRGLLRGLRGRPRTGSLRRGRMALCGQAAGAASLPSELIVHIFSFLSASDRLRASASCSHWRECLFYPALWPQLRICLRVSPSEQPRLEFLMRKCGWFVRELRVEFAAENYLSGGGGPGDGGRVDTRTGGEEVEALQLSTRWLEVLRTYLELVLCVLVSIRNNR